MAAAAMSVVYVLTTLISEDGGDDPTVKQVRKSNKWDNDDYVCRGLILKGMSDYLFDIYQNVESSKELWDSLEANYMAEDASSKKFLVSNFINYKMTDSRPVMEQYNELLGILGRFTQHKMNMDEAIQVSCIIDKLPLSWKDFKHTLKHKKGMIGRGCVDLRFSSGKIVSLFNVLHVPNIRKNLVSSSVLNNCGYKQVIESNKFVLSKHGVFIGFGYLSNQMFMLNIVNDNIASTFMSTSKPNDSILWHARLGHVHFKRMQNMSKDRLIPTFDMDTEKWFGVMGKRGIKCIIVGYGEHSKAFRFYVIEPNDSVLINSIIESKDAIFDENRFSSVPRPSRRSLVNGTEDIGCLVVPEEVTKEDDPKTFDEAMKSQDVAFWIEAINDKMDSIMGNNTWVLADLPLGCVTKAAVYFYLNYYSLQSTTLSRIMSSSTHPIIILYDSDDEDAFSSTTTLDYISASPDYFPASPGNTSSDSSEDSKDHSA
ncbi:zinc finger, CCHC-type containing protein [Tanacetum coccineum]